MTAGRRASSRSMIGLVLLCLGVVTIGIAVGLFVFAPQGYPDKTGVQGPWGATGGAAAVPDLANGRVIDAAETVGTMSVEVLRTGESDIDARVLLQVNSTVGDTTDRTTDFDVTLTLQAAGVEPLFNLDTMRFRSDGISFPVDSSAAGLPATVTGAQLAAVNGGRYPIGVSEQEKDIEMPVVYTDTWRPEIWIHPSSGYVLESHLRVTRTLQITTPAGLTLAAGTVSDLTMDLACDSTQTIAVDLEADAAGRPHREWVGMWLPLSMGVLAMAMIGGGLMLRSRQARP